MQNTKDPNYDKVKRFMLGMNQPVPESRMMMRDSDITQREPWLREEFNELNAAKEPVDILDALVDIDYIATGSLIAAGLRDDAPYMQSKDSENGVEACLLKCLVEHRRKDICIRRFPESVHALRAAIFAFCIPKGWKYHLAFNEVHQANMKKFWDKPEHPEKNKYHFSKSPEGWIAKRMDGKIMKPPGWTAPNLKKFL